MPSNQRLWQLKMKSQGRCQQCGAKTNKSACPACMKKKQANQKRYQKKHPTYMRDYYRKWRSAHPDYWRRYYTPKKAK